MLAAAYALPEHMITSERTITRGASRYGFRVCAISEYSSLGILFEAPQKPGGCNHRRPWAPVRMRLLGDHKLRHELQCDFEHLWSWAWCGPPHEALDTVLALPVPVTVGFSEAPKNRAGRVTCNGSVEGAVGVDV